MTTSTLRKLKGSTVVAIPSEMLERLGLGPAAEVELSVEAGRLIVTPRGRRRFTLDELMAQCDLDPPFTEAECDWQATRPAGKEAI